MMRARVEILSVAGCPNRQPTRELVERVAAELGVMPGVELVDVPDAEAAERLRFLGSPSVRVDGRDVEPGADERRGFGVSCRVYRTADGLSGQPAASWVRAALRDRVSEGRALQPYTTESRSSARWDSGGVP